MVIAVLVLSQNYYFAGKFSKRDNFLSLQLSDVVKHLVLFNIQSVPLHLFHDARIVAGLALPNFPSTGVGNKVSTPIGNGHFDFVPHALYLHDLPLQSSILFHVIAVNTVELSKD